MCAVAGFANLAGSQVLRLVGNLILTRLLFPEIFGLMAIILAHIYIGSVGMEGAYDAMGSGQVDEAWAHQHHSIWLDELKAKEGKADSDGQATPAE